MRGSEVVTFRKEATDDGMGDRGPAGPPIVLEGCAVYARGSSAEDSGRQVTTVTGWTVLIPPQEGVELLGSGHEAEWTSQAPGQWVKVEGRPFFWKDLQGAVLGVQVNLEDVAG